ncbi:unnamed protein product [Tilletia laevis]|nr:hypothetical protein CF335_g6805 [Tilletia laevis]CAD6955941.1 unnamed protein product [Tilletia laevis]
MGLNLVRTGFGSLLVPSTHRGTFIRSQTSNLKSVFRIETSKHSTSFELRLKSSADRNNRVTCLSATSVEYQDDDLEALNTAVATPSARYSLGIRIFSFFSARIAIVLRLVYAFGVFKPTDLNSSSPLPAASSRAFRRRRYFHCRSAGGKTSEASRERDIVVPTNAGRGGVPPKAAAEHSPKQDDLNLLNRNPIKRSLLRCYECPCFKAGCY